MVIRCTECGVHYDEKDLYEGLCRECAVEEDHDCKECSCPVCNFINQEEEERVDENEETRTETDYNPENKSWGI